MADDVVLSQAPAQIEGCLGIHLCLRSLGSTFRRMIEHYDNRRPPFDRFHASYTD